MGNRGQKRAETADNLPADKRSCSSLEFRPGSSTSPVQTPVTSTNSNQNMETSSSASASSRSESEAERDSAYGSCDSDEMGDMEHRRNTDALRHLQRQRSAGDHGKLKTILSSLSGNVGEFGQLAALTELCELLSFCTDGSFSSLMADSLSPILVKFARHENNPEIMLLSIRALTYLCDAHPRSSGFVVRHDGVAALCQRLMAIEYVDVAEQCLQALEKISREQPLACLQSGVIMASLTYVDFFATSIQRVALSTVLNICEKLPSECPSSFMEAVPILCNILQYEDSKLVETVASCLIKIAEQAHHSPDKLEELSKHGLIHQVTHLIDLNTRTTLCQPVYTGLIGILVKLASGSLTAIKTLFELNISNILKDILSYTLSHGVPSSPRVDGHCNQALEVLKLLNELLPAIGRDQEVQLAVEKEVLLVSQPDILPKFGIDLLPVLIQIVNSGGDLYICYGCLSVINKLVYFSKSDILLELLESTDISSFLAGVFTRKDHHVLTLALQIVDNILQKLSAIYMGPFVKEGVFFAIDSLLTPEKGSQYDSSQRSASRDARKCLCYSLDAGQSPSTSESGSCELAINSVQNLANHIKTTYFATESLNSENGVTDILQNLKASSTTLSDLVNMSMDDSSFMQNEEKLFSILHQIMSQLNGSDPISTFEFVESGVVKSLADYLLNEQCSRRKTNINGEFSQSYVTEKRLEVFGKLFLTSSNSHLNSFQLSALILKLLSALSSVENFPVILNPVFKERNSYVTVPQRRWTTYPSLKIQFVRGEAETHLSDCFEDVVNVDPFSSFDAIEEFLWPKVGKKRNECKKPIADVLDGNCSHLPLYSSPQNPDLMEIDGMSKGMHGMKDLMEQEQRNSTHEDRNMSIECPESCSYEDASPKLLFYLGEEQLNQALNFYQAILQLKSKAENDTVTAARIWSQIFIVTYKRASKGNGSNLKQPDHQSSSSSWSYNLYTPLFSCMSASKLSSAVEKFSSTYDILSLLRILEDMNRYRFHLMTRERICAFAEGKIDDLDNVKVQLSDVLKNEIMSCRLTEKLEQQMRDPLAISTGGMPPWCVHLMDLCPFLFGFEGKCKYFKLAAFGKRQSQSQPSSSNSQSGVNNRHQNNVTSPRRKFLVYRHRILESAAKMMDLHARQKVVLEVEYDEEVGTGLGPTLEFYTLVSHEFQKPGLSMWREDNISFPSIDGLETNSNRIVGSPFGLFPRPWSSAMSESSGVEFSEVVKKFVLLGQVVAKALQDGRVLDLSFSKAFYKLILGQDLSVYDIQSFDPELGRVLIEFQALVQRRKYLESYNGKSIVQLELSFRNTTIEDLYLDFTLPGYPDYVLFGTSIEMVNLMNLEQYIALVVDATVNSGISRQMDAFRSGFNQVFPISHLQIFNEEELERLLCGERELWNSSELSDHVKFDHGYTASSPPIIYLLEIIQEFNHEQQKAFLRFVTGAPRLPPGGLASLNPKLTIVRKHCSQRVDEDLPSVMTCANYLKLPPYSSKEIMKEKLLYAITEGQGSFHLS